MKIKNLKINGFGKLKDKEITLEDGINVIYGKNEAGKSTLLKYITSMFYGLSKNKNGGSVPEIEKYEPWNSEEFSGKISYELDNNETYEVYRDFKKKNPKIFNKNFEDISKKFNIDKTKGNQFFYDQIGLEEEIFTSSIITKQAEVKLGEKEQNTLIQKISNILGTGEDTNSYSTIINRLKKKLTDEVGTSNTKERPINIVESRIEELILQKNELEKYNSYKFDLDIQISKIDKEIEKLNRELEELKIKKNQEEKIREVEIDIYNEKNMLSGFIESTEELTNNTKKYKKDKNNRLQKTFVFIGVISLVIGMLVVLCINMDFTLLIPILFLIYIIYVFFQLKKYKNYNKEIKEKQRILDIKIKQSEEAKINITKRLEELEKEYNEELAKREEEEEFYNLEYVLNSITIKQLRINEEKLKLHTLKLDDDNIAPKLEKLVNIKEELESLKEEKLYLDRKRDNIKRTIQYLEVAYNKMKEQITPKFTEELSKVMKKISDGKYKNVRINTNGEIIVEANNGEYINAENLSIGTIDQLYLSLRLATIKEITKENMPIILDEAFAYYDDNRLENILNYLVNEYENKQVIIFTCTKREIEILKNLKIKYNLIQL